MAIVILSELNTDKGLISGVLVDVLEVNVKRRGGTEYRVVTFANQYDRDYDIPCIVYGIPILQSDYIHKKDTTIGEIYYLFSMHLYIELDNKLLELGYNTEPCP